ncbi:MAG: hypothetical protein GWO38_29765 [Phycisphaerae bacterium]|nr:hypothetical protein [Phycisphaerae bacterium]NIX31704.1 hypothetical protein [Phycisphaerae bacterium]
MRLEILDNGHSRIQKVFLSIIRKMMGGFVPGPIMIQSYRPNFFGKPYNETVDAALRKSEYWTKTEVELLAAFISRQNQCQFCMIAHSAIASEGVEKTVVDMVLDDWRTAPVSEPLRATLGFVEKLTKTPGQVTAEDLEPVYAAGVSRQGIEEAIRVVFVFSVINRLADAFDFELARQGKQQKRMGFLLFNMGYGIAAVPG